LNCLLVVDVIASTWRCGRKRVDVAVLDVHLPDGHGTDLIPELKAANPQATAVLLTASMDPAEIRHARECGAAALLNKLDELGDALETVKRVHSQPTA
jgi:DNA-binding NarL/FixJ family response regulator